MSLEESITQLNIANVKNIFILATVFLVIALVQILKPTFSLTYHINSKASYTKAKLISKLITSATLYILGLYFYYFTNLAQRSWYDFWAVWIIIFLYYVYKWGFTKIFDFKSTKAL